MCDRDNCARYENHFINATFGQNSISDAVRAPSYQLLSAAGCMSDSDSNNIVKKKGRPWRKTWELHRVKNRGRIGQECCGIWHLLSPLSWDDGSHLSPARVCSPALLSAPLHIYSDGTRGDLTLSNGPCEGENVSLWPCSGGMLWWPSVPQTACLSMEAVLISVHVYVLSDSVERLFWTTDVVCVIENPFHTAD